MSATKVDLLTDEEIVLESEGAILTNQRIITNWHERRSDDKKIPTQAYLKDIASFRKIEGGQEGRLKLGINALATGLILTVVQLLFRDFISEFSLIENVLFLVGTLSLIAGAYFTVASLMRVKPHTTILFLIPAGDDMPVYFPGRENPDAERFSRQFARTKRGIQTGL